MTVTSSWRKLLVVCITLAIMATSAVLPAAAQSNDMSTGAGRFVENLAAQALDAMAKYAGKRTELVSPFRKLLTENFDIKTIGVFALGPYWNEASPEQQNEYLSLFETTIVQTYADRLSTYSGEVFKVMSSRSETEQDSIVVTEISSLHYQYKVEWRVRQIGANFKVIDVIAEGVSLVATYRSEFSSVIQARGGKVDDLLQALRDKTAAFR